MELCHTDKFRPDHFEVGRTIAENRATIADMRETSVDAQVVDGGEGSHKEVELLVHAIACQPVRLRECE